MKETHENPSSPSAGAAGSAGWSEIPCAEGWWWDSDNRDWVEVGSADLSTAIVDLDWRGLWYDPIIIPEKPNARGQAQPPTATVPDRKNV